MSKLYSIMSDLTPMVKEVGGPSVTSEDPNERKLARRERIQRRVDALRRQAIKDMGEEILEEKKPIEIQMETSTVILEKFLKESQEYLEDIKVVNEVREVNRRESEGVGRAKVIAQLETEAAEAQKEFNDISGKWAGIQDYKDPLHIQKDILEQKIKCDELIKQKEEIITMLKNELKLAESKFTKDQMKQNQDIRILGQRIANQIHFMKSAYNTEFRLIELTINEEKQKYIDRSNKKCEDLTSKRDQEEKGLSEYRFRKREEVSHNLNKLILTHEDEFRQTKIQLELDVQNSQYEFERIKYELLSYNERLDYNYQVLKRRENENLTIKSQQKRRINKLHDVIIQLLSRLSSYRENTKKQMEKILSNIKKMHRSIMDIDSKADLFAMVNDNKFNAIWEMNTKECFDLLAKIIHIDKILHEQQMGLEWNRPIYRRIDKTTMPSYQRAVEIVRNFTLKPRRKPCLKGEVTEVTNVGHDKLLKYILQKISNKNGFLTEKCLKQLINRYEDDQQSLVTLYNVFLSLEIRRQEDIDFMIDYFLPYCYCPICSEAVSVYGSIASSALSRRPSLPLVPSRTSLGKSSYYNHSVVELEEASNAIQQSNALIDYIVVEVIKATSLVDEKCLFKIELPEKTASEDIDLHTEIRDRTFSRRRTQKRESEKMLCKFNHPLVLSTVYVLTALKNFVTCYYKQIDPSPTVDDRLVKKRLTISRLTYDKDIEDYWLFIKNIYNDSKTKTWNSLCEGLMRYLEVLKERKHVSEEVLKLRKRNKDLKTLLAKYMDHGVLMTAPCALQNEVLAKCSIPPYTDHK